ncbi:LysR family transcriptional regulator [Pollutimonas harenae]|uniref:LysR family transcriptional regulator n=1 Tax=Pollutimonas harenae TaxID=657015 RepID=A0A853GY67_9BURK|nr:LysR family transcriptional regulator [Pollutimonas harenae]NYT84319.1 LysR family transcriptional regulator [Pollutimonas harenae]TEA73279.1 LysR family transcriptional regulator [Pollutimonas harenae]
MKLVWLQDLLAVAETGSLSKAATLRHSSQSALSRRIQAFEQWLDVGLIDRSANPIRLTPVARRFLPQLQALTSDAEQIRIRMQSENRGATRLVLATQHSLTITRLPHLFEKLSRVPSLNVDLRVLSEDYEQCLSAFLRGEADLLMCMEDQDGSTSIELPGAERLYLGEEKFVPISVAGPGGKPLHKLGGKDPFRLLAFPADSFVGRSLYRRGLNCLYHEHRIQIVNESHFLAGIKEMAIAGLGAAWLPESMVRREIDTGQLVLLKGELRSISLPIALYAHPQVLGSAATLRVWEALSE